MFFSKKGIRREKYHYVHVFFHVDDMDRVIVKLMAEDIGNLAKLLEINRIKQEKEATKFAGATKSDGCGPPGFIASESHESLRSKDVFLYINPENNGIRLIPRKTLEELIAERSHQIEPRDGDVVGPYHGRSGPQEHFTEWDPA